jgi:hypothetical protein
VVLCPGTSANTLPSRGNVIGSVDVALAPFGCILEEKEEATGAMETMSGVRGS